MYKIINYVNIFFILLEMVYIIQWNHALRWRSTRYKSAQLVVQNCFIASFEFMCGVFHHAWSTCLTTETRVVSLRKFLQKVEHRSTLSNKFWLCCLVNRTCKCHTTNLLILCGKLKVFASPISPLLWPPYRRATSLSNVKSVLSLFKEPFFYGQPVNTARIYGLLVTSIIKTEFHCI